MPVPSDVQRLIAALEAQRAVLGDAAVDFALAAMREKLATLPSGPPRLRQVSVLFCDIADSTSLLQHLGAEDALEVVGAALRRFAEQVASAGGKVLRFTGDGLKAAFGSEQTREDDAVRAVQAGLAILEQAQAHAQHIRGTHAVQRFGVRIGIDTGPVVLGGSVEADNTAMGHAVHIAARLEQTAPVGELRISHRTWVQVRGLFEMEKEPPLSMKGSDKPLQTYLVRSALPPADHAANRGPLGAMPAMVGRDTELSRLLALVEHTGRHGQLRAATILGEAGVGKSRLLRELQQALAPAGRLTLLVRAQPSSPLRPYGVLRDTVARWLHIADDENAASARRKLVDGIAPLNGEHGEMAAHLIGRLIGLDFPDSPHVSGVEGRQLRDRAFRALRQSLLMLAARNSVLLLLLDDLHWADDGSLEFVRQLVESAETAQIAIVATARPTLLERLPGWLEGASRHTRIELAPLDAVQGEVLAIELLQSFPEPPPVLLRMLVTRADGNPFFMEELVRMLLDDGVIDSQGPQWELHDERLARLRIPETLVGVLQARLDALSGGERSALQTASIVGALFWEATLTEIDASAVVALPELQRRGLVRAREHSAFEGAGEYAFHHQLLHEVTYGTVLKAVRRDGHARTARWLADRVADRAAEFLAITAEHYDRAGDSAQALAYFERASLDAGRRHAHSACRVYAERALAQAALTDPLARYWLLARLCSASDALGDVAAARQALDDMGAHAEACDDDAMRAHTLAVQALQADRDGDLARAAEAAEGAVSLGEPSGAAPAVTLGHGELAWLALKRSDYAAADAHLRAALSWARQAALLPRDRGGFVYEHQLRLIAVTSLVQQDDYVDAAAELDLLDATCPAAVIERLSLLEQRSNVATLMGDLDGAQRFAESGLALARQLDVPRWQMTALKVLAGLAETREDPAAQRQCAREAIEIANRVSVKETLGDLLALEGSALHRLGDAARGQERVVQAIELHRQNSDSRGAALAVARLAEMAHADAGVTAAMRHVEEILTADPLAAELDPEGQVRCLRVLLAAGDPRADTSLRALQERLDRIQRQLPDDASRKRLATALPHWRWLTRQGLRTSR